MRKRELILTTSSLFVFLFGILAQAGEKPGDTPSPLIYKLVVDKKVGPSTDTVMCRLRIRNDTDALQRAFRPQEKDITLIVERAEPSAYSVVFEGNPFFGERPAWSWNQFDIWLRPHCTMEIKLAKIVLRGPAGARTALPVGRYAVTAAWKDPNLPKVTGSAFEVVEQDVPAVPPAPASGNEYPFDAVLEPASKIYYRDEPVDVAIRLENRGNDAVVLMNYFSPYHWFFLFEKKYATSGEKVQDPRVFRGTVTPHTLDGWIMLLPGEHLLVNLDIKREFSTPAKYSVTAIYLERPSLHPLQGEPHYAKQYKWPSSEAVMTILDAPKPNGQSATQGHE
jgi:hypothetical protein